MFEKFGTPAFLREARASGGRRFAPVVMVLIFFAVYVVSGYAEGFLMTPFLVAVFLSDGALYGMLSDGTDAAEIYTYIEQMTVKSPAIMLGMLFAGVGSVLIAALFCRFIEHRPLSSMGFRRVHALRSVLLGLLLGLLSALFALGFALVFGAVRLTGVNGGAWGWTVAFLLGTAVRALAEESLFRGLLTVSLGRRMPLALAVLTAAFAEAAMSGGGLLGYANAFLLSFACALVMIRTGTVFGSVAFRTVWRFAVGVLFGASSFPVPLFAMERADTGVPVHGGASGLGFGLCATFALALATAVLAMMRSVKDEDAGIPHCDVP